MWAKPTNLPADGTVTEFTPRPGFRPEVKIEPGHAIRKTKGDGENYGVHSVGIRIMLHGPKATISFLMWTGIVPETEGTGYDEHWVLSPHGLMAADLGYHADAPEYEGQRSMECIFRESGQCFYDGSGLQAEPVLELMIKRGSGAVLQHLEGYYFSMFGEEPIELQVVPPKALGMTTEGTEK